MKVLNEQLFSLIKNAQAGSSAAMNELIKSNERLIWDIAKRFYGRGCEADDLFQLGALGMIKAVKNFELERGLAFSTYAVPMIMGEIKRFLRDDGPVKVSRSLREIASKARRCGSELTQKNGREATVKEIASVLGIPEEEISAAISASERPDSINRPAYGEGSASLGEIIEDSSRFDEKLITKISLAEAAEKLDGRDRQILVLRYFKNMTQSKVAEKLGISQVQVSRLEKKMLEKMKKLMA